MGNDYGKFELLFAVLVIFDMLIAFVVLQVLLDIAWAMD